MEEYFSTKFKWTLFFMSPNECPNEFSNLLSFSSNIVIAAWVDVQEVAIVIIIVIVAVIVADLDIAIAVTGKNRMI